MRAKELEKDFRKANGYRRNLLKSMKEWSGAYWAPEPNRE